MCSSSFVLERSLEDRIDLWVSRREEKEKGLCECSKMKSWEEERLMKYTEQLIEPSTRDSFLAVESTRMSATVKINGR